MASDWTIEDIYKLKAAIAKGVKKVQYQDKMIEYASIDEMLKVLSKMEQELGLKKKSSRVLAEFDKGTC